MPTVEGQFPELDSGPWRLRQIGAADRPRVFEGLSDPQVIAHYGVSYASLQATQVQMDWFDEIYRRGSGLWWGVVERERPACLIGACGLNDLVRQHRRAEIGYWLLPTHWRRGIMRRCLSAMIDYAFGQLDLHRLGADVDDDNHASIALLNAMGFRYEGRRRAYEWKQGAPLDLLNYALLAPDWRSATVAASP